MKLSLRSNAFLAGLIFLSFTACQRKAAISAHAVEAKPSTDAKVELSTTTAAQDEEVERLPPTLLDDVGEPNLLLLHSFDSKRHWLVYCAESADLPAASSEAAALPSPPTTNTLTRSRENAFLGWLAVGKRPPYAVDDWVGVSANGQLAAYYLNEKLFIVSATDDAQSGAEPLQLEEASYSASPFSYTPPRSAIWVGDDLYFLAKDSTELISFSGNKKATSTIALPIIEGDIDAPIAGLRTDDSEHIILDIVDSDTNKDSKFRIPSSRNLERETLCRSGLSRYRIPSRLEDIPTPYLLQKDGSWLRLAGLARSTKERFLIRQSDLSLVLKTSAAETVIAAAACEAKIYHLHPSGSFVYSCKTPSYRRQLNYYSPKSGVKALELDIADFGQDLNQPFDGEWLPIETSDKSFLFNLLTAALIDVQSKDAHFIGAYNDYAVFSQSDKLKAYSLSENHWLDLVYPFSITDESLQRAHFIWAKPWLIDLKAQQFSKPSFKTVLGLSSDGQLLIAEESEAPGVYLGPLRWQAPTPEPQSSDSSPIDDSLSGSPLPAPPAKQENSVTPNGSIR